MIVMLHEKKSRLQAACGTGRPALKSAAGFTLVELIVVIAILAILTGVGTMAYSGYISYTNKQMDENLKNEIIYAGAVGSYANPGAQGTITVTQNSEPTVGGTDPDIVAQWMEDAFGADWKNTVRLRTDKVSIQNMPLPYGSTSVNLGMYRESNFYGKEAETLTSVDNVATAAATYIDYATSKDKYQQYCDQQNLMNQTPLSYDEWAKNQTKSTIESICSVAGDDFMAKYGLNEDSTSTEISNALVLEMASKASNLTAEDAMNVYLNPDEADVMTMMGLNMAILTGYVNSEGADPDAVKMYNEAVGGKDPSAVLAMAMGASDSDMIGYLEEYLSSGFDADENIDTSSAVYADVAGYLAALQVLNEYSGEFSGSLDGADLYSSDEALALFQMILGNAQ